VTLAPRPARKKKRKITLLDLEKLVDLWVLHYNKLNEADKHLLPLRRDRPRFAFCAHFRRQRSRTSATVCRALPCGRDANVSFPLFTSISRISIPPYFENPATTTLRVCTVTTGGR
jgi:hypothetical protein